MGGRAHQEVSMQGQVQRYQLKGSDQVKLNKTGSVPTIEIGEYQFTLPTNTGDLQKFVSSWQQASAQIQNLSESYGSTNVTGR
jgi:hypothetical protein